MLQTRIIAGLTELSATAGYLHRKGSDEYTGERRRLLLPTESAYDWEEVEQLPAYTQEEYEAKVEELIRQRYTTGQELALINNHILGSDQRHALEYERYQAFRTECKARARELLSQQPDEPES